MREILFRGKRLDNGEWMEGSLMKVTVAERTYYLIFGDGFAYDSETMKALAHACVDPDTVGQYTGLKDKGGKRIFEGDIVCCSISGGNYQGYSWGNQLVVFDRGAFCVVDHHGDAMPLSSYAPRVEIEVVGNVHDNPELLKGG